MGVGDHALAEGQESKEFPDPILGGGTEGRLVDTDGDGKPNAAAMHSTFASGVLIDADEDSIGDLKPGDPADDAVKSRKIRPQASIITQGRKVWARYDVDNDGKFDLALVADNTDDPALLVATSAWKLGARDPTPHPDEIGRKIMRPGLLHSPRSTFSAFRLAGSDIAADEGMGSLPDPIILAERGSTIIPIKTKGLPDGTTLESTRGNTFVYLVDANHHTKLPVLAKDPDIVKLVHDGKFDAQIAIVGSYNRGYTESQWVYYDTDNDGKFDLVLYAPDATKDPTGAYRVDKDGKLALDDTALKGKQIRYSVYKDKLLGAKVKQVVQKVFAKSQVEE